MLGHGVNLTFWTLRLAAILATCSSAPAADPLDLYFSEVRPLLHAKCVQCHGPETQEAKLRLDTAEGILRGGEHGSLIKAGDPQTSLLWKSIRHEGEIKMPPKERLPESAVKKVEAWIQAGGRLADPVRVLWEDEPAIVAVFSKGDGRCELDPKDRASGEAALVIGRQRAAERVAGWKFAIREKPNAGQYRYLRFAWKKRGGGGMMLEVARGGEWRKQGEKNGAWFAGKNTTGWPAHEVAATAPAEWTLVTRDLWADGAWGDFDLTGICLTSFDGGEMLVDSILLARSREDLDAYKPGRGEMSLGSLPSSAKGDAWSDPANPIRLLFKGERLDLWSLKKVERPILPDIRQKDWTRDAIDHFLLAEMESANLAPALEADRATLIRRLSFDLRGLPPEPTEVQEFVADPAPDAYERLVDRWLADPAYGQRWARHWLDVVRYADTNGFERDEFRPQMFRYRDYVVRALNADKAYDRFVAEQLAGDELAAEQPKSSADLDSHLATGFLRLGQYDSTGAIFQEDKRNRDQLLGDLANTTGAAFLGLSLACCQCHDHKYDPLSQADHYRLRAFFAGVKFRDDIPVEPLEGGPSDKKKLGATTATDSGKQAPATHLLFQGDFHEQREEISPGFLSVLDPTPAKIKGLASNTTGRRSALAAWIASPENPLTARVIVNRLWQHHFGRGLVATPNDFGYSGARPTHPELLNYLAAELFAQGWSLKQMQRRMVLSAAYRQQSFVAADRLARDPENRHFSRQNPQRLDAETLRDAMLAASGSLLPVGAGRAMWPPVPEELMQAQPSILEAIEKKDEGRMQGWYADKEEACDVRSLFLVQKRCLPLPFLQTFDLPENSASCGRRDVTTVAPQALTLLNNDFSIRMAKSLAARARREAGEAPQAQIARAVWLAFGRAPAAEEADVLLVHYQRQCEANGEQRALAEVCRALLNANEFLYID